MDFDQIHPEVQKASKRLLKEGLEDVYRCGDTGLSMGYWVESHTLGCRKEAGDPDLWAAHWAVWEEYSKDGKSVLIGDPADGVFVSITPLKDRSASMGAEMLIELGRRAKKTVPLAKAERLSEGIREWLEPYVTAAVIAGSVRRRRPQVGDVELVILPDDWASFAEALDINGWEGGDRIRKKVVDGIPVELYIAHDVKEMGAMLFMYTGDWQHNIAMRSIAKRMGWKLDQYGIWDAKTGKPLLQSPDEREFYDFLGVSWHDPEDRSFKDRPKKGKKRATMGAEMLIELGSTKRKAGYIQLELLTPEEDGTDNWVLRVERVDPFGGPSWQEDFLFADGDEARRWFSGIVGDEDLDLLIAQISR